MNPRRCKDVLIAYFRIVTGGNPRRGPHQRVRLVRNDILFVTCIFSSNAVLIGAAFSLFW
mgnify:CR=1 FL=1